MKKRKLDLQPKTIEDRFFYIAFLLKPELRQEVLKCVKNMGKALNKYKNI